MNFEEYLKSTTLNDRAIGDISMGDVKDAWNAAATTLRDAMLRTLCDMSYDEALKKINENSQSSKASKMD